MAIEQIKTVGTISNYKTVDPSLVTYPYPVRAIVKDNIDDTHSGTIRVYISGGLDPDNEKSWVSVKYMSPYFGVISPDYNLERGQDTTGDGSFAGNPHSYGFWATAPDIGSEVICIFINGKIDDGYYIGAAPVIGVHHMVPAIGSSKKIVPNESESSTYAGADKLPVCEVNYSNPKIKKSEKIYSESKPVHSYQAAILNKQGIIKDNLRGVISSSSQRETPSKVFGMATPGQAIYKGGFDNKTISSAIKDGDKSKLQLVGRTGGHSIVLDDGTVDGKDQLMRLRTSAGHMIMMNDSGQNLFIIHSNGQSWIELGKEGTIDMYATNSVNIRTCGDINYHSDRDINIHAKRNLNMYAENIKMESKLDFSTRVGKNFENYTVGKFTVRVDQQMSLFSTGDSSFTSDANNYIVGSTIYLNTGNTGTVPEVVNKLPQIDHVEAIFDQSVGWTNSVTNADGEKLSSIANRVTTHQPWVAANKGVDVQVKQSLPSSAPAPSTMSSAANISGSNTPVLPVSTGAALTVPSQSSIASSGTTVLNSSTVNAIASQQSASASILNTQEKLNTGLLDGRAGISLSQASLPGQMLKPGTAGFVNDLQRLGINTQNIGSNLTTGNMGIKSMAAAVQNTTAQVTTLKNSLETASSQLRNSGALNGTEADTQSAGLISAAAKYGANTVTNVVQAASGLGLGVTQRDVGIVPNISSQKIVTSISDGKYAAELSDKVTSGFKSLAPSIDGILGGAGISSSSLSQLPGVVSSTAKNVSSIIQKSFGALKSGVSNTLGASSSQQSPSQTQQFIQQFEQSQLEITQAENAYFDAIKLYRTSSTPENYGAVQNAELVLSQARQKSAQTSTKIIDSLSQGASANMLSENTGAKSFSNVTSTLTSGINAFPGGLGAFATQISGSTTNFVSNIKNFTTGLSPQIPGYNTNALSNLEVTAQKLKNPSQLAGNLVQGLNTSISQAIGSVTDQAGSIKKSAASAISQISSTLAGIGSNSNLGKLPVLASNTASSDKAVILEKSRELLGNPIIPLPNFDSETPSNSDVATYQTQQSKIIDEITDLKFELKIAQYTLDQLKSGLIDSEASRNSVIIEQNTIIQTLSEKIAEKQLEFERILDTGYSA